MSRPSGSASGRNRRRTNFTFVDLFAGIGGFRMALDQLGGRCVFTSERDRHAVEVYRKNFGAAHVVEGDVRDLDSRSIPHADMLVAGFPCQPFSIAGVSKKNSLGRSHGFACETQGTLFFEVARIIKETRPRVFLLENVKNLVRHDSGRTFEVILRVLSEELGYRISWRVLDASGYVPQRRERVFIVGFRDGPAADFSKLKLPNRVCRMREILHPEDGTESEESPYTVGEQAVVNPKYRLSGRLWRYLRGYALKHKRAGNGFGYGLVGPDDVARTLSARYFKDGAEILVRRSPYGVPRRLTPRECARLMGFDRKGRRRFILAASEKEAYRQMGNAVVVPLARAVAKWALARLAAAPVRK